MSALDSHRSLAIGLPIICALALQFAFPNFLSNYPFVTFVLPVFLSSWLGGRTCGLLATAVNTLLIWYIFLPEKMSFVLADPQSAGSLLIFAITGVVIALVHEDFRLGTAAARREKEHLEQREVRRSAELVTSLAATKLSEARLSSIVDSAMDAIISIDDQHNIILFNAAAESLFRCSASLVMGGSLARFIPHASRAAHGSYIDSFGETGVTSRSMRSLGILTAVRADASEFPIEASISQVEVAGQRIFTVILRDISERLRAEAAVKEKEHRLESVIESLSEGLILNSADGKVLHWNRAALAMHEFSQAPSDGDITLVLSEFRSIYQLTTLDGESVPFEQWPVNRLLAGESLHDLRLKLRRLDCEWERIFSYGGTLLDTETDGPMALLSVSDITKRYLAEQAVRESEDRLQAVTENLNEGLVLARPDGRLVHWNRAALQMHGYTSVDDCLQALPFFADVFTLDTLEGRNLTSEQWPMARVLAGEHLRDLDIRVRRKDGTIDKILRFSGSIIVDSSAQPIAFVAIDDVTEAITAQRNVKRLNAELEHRVKERTSQLEAANKELEAFSYSVSHDLRAPLRALDGFSLALLEDYGRSLDAEGQRYLDTIRRSAQKMGALIDDLLAFSRLSKLRLNEHLVSADSTVRQALDELSGQVSGRDVVLTVEPLPDCLGDAALLKQVWINLLSNALKYTQRKDTATIEVGSYREGGELVYFVRDNGTGFDMRYADKLFGVFQRLHRAEDFEGTGVGLAIVSRIVSRHGGRVWAQSEEGKGAAFFFTLREKAKS